MRHVADDPAVRTVVLAGLSVVAVMIIADGAQAGVPGLLAAMALGLALAALALGIRFWATVRRDVRPI